MAAINFPTGPQDGDTYIAANSAQYRFYADTQSWLVIGSTSGGGTVSSVNVTGVNGIDVDSSTDGPVTDIGTFALSLKIDGPQGLPPLPED